jgi:hypothetical protein
METKPQKKVTSLRGLQEKWAAASKADPSHPKIIRERGHVVHPNDLYIPVEDNIRPINWKTVREYADAMKRGDVFPPIQVDVDSEERIRVRHGFHRALAAKMAIDEGATMQGLDVTEFQGNSADAIFLMLNTDSSLVVDPVSRAEAYLKLYRQKFTPAQIAKGINGEGDKPRTATHVESNLLLAMAENEVKELVREGRISATEVIDIMQEERAGGRNHVEVVNEMIKNAAAVGAPKATKKHRAAPAANTGIIPKLRIKEVSSTLSNLVGISHTLRAALDEQAVNALSASVTTESTDAAGEATEDPMLSVALPASKMKELLELLDKQAAVEQALKGGNGAVGEEENAAGAENVDDDQTDMFKAPEAVQ